MKKIFLSALFLLSTTSYSQELDKAYLESLPENVRADVLDKIADREVEDSPVYRRPSSMIKKPLDDSKRFGAKIFNMMQTSFMPINEPNFDSSYVLDFGDTLEIQLVGQKNSIEELSIKRDGSINISEIGKVSVAGLTLESASSLIKNKISNAYIGIEAFVTLVNIRDIQVLITGNAYNPGIYTLNGNSNLLHALSMAGGIDENGSYRQIELIRDNVVINSIDLYDIFIHGKSGFGHRLRSGDSILIKPTNELVALTGAVKRPGVYELTSDEDYSDLFAYGNGFSASADHNSLRIERLNKEEAEFISISELKDLSSMKPVAGDRLNVRSYIRKSVTIAGAVKTPGTYIVTKDDTLMSLIEKAEGYTDDAYPFGGVLNNKRAEEINTDAVDKLYNTYVQKLISKGDALFASESLPFILDELKKSKISGRVMAEFDLDVIRAKPQLDTNLDDGDTIIIPSKTQQIYIYGEVNNPGTARYTPGQSIQKYLEFSGGVLDSADNKNIYVVHPNGELNRVSGTSRLSFLDNRGEDILIYPGSVIYIPRKVNSRDPAMVASIWAPIVSALALSITSLSVLDKN
ncbi:SLBB domain-containing protein [Gammaproteobacteria bacterium]|nr:SLBB domain-containing protein [Gammaproteobacteria bacterium]